MDSELQKILTGYKDITVVSTQEYETVEQIEDGVRGETNSKIKKIFLDDYYIYDGTTIRASQIQNAKYKAGSNDPDDFSGSIVASYGTKDKDKKELSATKEEISGKINITRDSLNAFALLKNMRTLDAEYIYHDFKELIVELNYFDREDLLEHGKQVMMYPLAGTNSTEWPVGGIDKYPTYYGTLIHSKADYEVLYNNQEADKLQAKLDLKTNASEASHELEYLRTGKGSNKKFHKDTFFETAQACWEHVVEKKFTYDSQESLVPPTNFATMNDKQFVSWVLYEYGYDNLKDSSGLGYGFFKTSTDAENKYGFKVDLYSSGEEYIDKLRKGDIISFGTGSSQDNGYVVIVASITIDEKDKKVVKAYDCSKAINWTSSNRVSGVDVTKLIEGNKAGARVIRVDINPVLTYDTGFEGGEPVVAPVSGQVIDYGTTSRKNVETGVEDKEDKEVGYIKIKVLDGRDSPFCEEIQEPDGFGDSPSAFLKDNYTDKEIDKLGYDYFQEEYQDAGIAGDIIYIEGFDISEVLSKGKAKGESSDESEDDFTHTKPEDNTIRGGGGNFVMDLEDLKITQNVSTKTKTVKNSRKGSKVIVNSEHKTNIEKLASYVSEYASNRYSTQYVVPNMQDKKAEFATKVKEEAKKEANFSMDVNGKIYIKEGAVIGFTYESDVNDGVSQVRDINYIHDGKIEKATNAGSVGNYLRIIMRDLHDEVIENVEDYIEKFDAKPRYNITEKFMYWMAFTSEGALVPKDDQGLDENGKEKPKEYYASVNGKDGMGNSGPFGLTYCCADAAANVGYTNFNQHQQEDGKVPLVEGEDVFAAVLEAEKEEVYNGLVERDEKLLKRTSDYMFLALVDLAHAGPVMLNEQLDKFQSQGYLTRLDFQNNWGTAEKFKDGLEGRAIRRGILALDEFYTAGNKKQGLSEVIWLSETPWSDFLRKHDTRVVGGEFGEIFGGSAIKLITYKPREGQFDGI